MAIAARPTVLADVLIPRHWVQTQVNRAVVDFALMFGFAWFVALFAQLAIRLPWTPVPITGQTFAVLVAGGALGSLAWGRRSAYLHAHGHDRCSRVSLPAPARSSDATERGEYTYPVPMAGKRQPFPGTIASGGYIVGFILAAWVVGRLCGEVVGPKIPGAARDAGRQRHPVCAWTAMAGSTYRHRVDCPPERRHRLANSSLVTALGARPFKVASTPSSSAI